MEKVISEIKLLEYLAEELGIKDFNVEERKIDTINNIRVEKGFDFFGMGKRARGIIKLNKDNTFNFSFIIGTDYTGVGEKKFGKDFSYETIAKGPKSRESEYDDVHFEDILGIMSCFIMRETERLEGIKGKNEKKQ